MKLAVFTPTRRPGLDVTYYSLVRQTGDRELLWIVGDELYQQRPKVFECIPSRRRPEFVHFDSARLGTRRFTLNAAYNEALKKARWNEVDLMVSLQDYIWIPDDGLARMEQMAGEHPDTLITGLLSHSLEPGRAHLGDPTHPWSIFANPQSAKAKPQIISWHDWRGERLPRTDPHQTSPHWWESNWALIGHAPLYDETLRFPEHFDDGLGLENVRYAFAAEERGYPSWLDPQNHAIGLPHRDYFPDDLAVQPDARNPPELLDADLAQPRP